MHGYSYNTHTHTHNTLVTLALVGPSLSHKSRTGLKTLLSSPVGMGVALAFSAARAAV